jgi:hypothetical protein
MPAKSTSSKPSLPASDAELLALYVAALDELRARGITRSDNIPTGDYAERVVARHFGVELEKNSAKGYDLRVAADRVQVKSRRVDARGRHNGFGILRNVTDCAYQDREFDVLVTVVFERDYRVREAWWVPWEAVKKHAGYSKRWNAARLTNIGGGICSERAVRKLDLAGG